MGFLRRVFGRTGSEEATPAAGTAPPDLEPEPAPEPGAAPPPAEAPAPLAEAVASAACPSCGDRLDPPPERNRRCPACREPIVVRHADGRTVYLTEDAIVAFDLERGRLADEARWTAERDTWLLLAASVHADEARHAELAAAMPSDAVVVASHDFYIATADAAARTARKTKHWADLARIRRAQAAALFHAAGNPVPPSEEIVALHAEGMLAELRALSEAYTYAELVGAGCCRACRVGDGKVFKIVDETRTLRLPHDGCPKGICACDWWLATLGPKKRRGTRREAPKPDEVAAG